MATIGLKDLYYAPITEDEDGAETFGTPKILSKAISAELSVEYAEGTLYADDALDENPKAFSSGTLTLGVKELGSEAAAACWGPRWTTTACWYPLRRTWASRWPSASGP